jgi:hypothetical protein
VRSRWLHGKRCKYLLMATVCLIGCFVGNALAGQDLGGKVPVEKMLSTTSYTVAGSAHVLELLQIPIPKPSDAELLHFLSTHRGQTSFPNAAFVLTDESRGSEEKRMVWIHYAFLDEAIRPAPIWSGALTRAGEGSEAFVVLSKSIAWDVTLSVFDVKLSEDIGHYPPALNPEDIDEWPKATAPISHLEKKLIDKDISGIRAIKAEWQDDHLLLVGEREQKSTPTVTFQFTPHSGEWKQLEARATPRAGDRPND